MTQGGIKLYWEGEKWGPDKKLIAEDIHFKIINCTKKYLSILHGQSGFIIFISVGSIKLSSHQSVL